MEPSAAVMEIPKAFSMPALGRAYGRPPLRYVGNRQVTVSFKTAPEVLARLVPAPVQPNPENRLDFYSGLMQLREPVAFSYKEVGLMVPVSYGSNQGFFVAYMFLDSIPAILGGREIWGFPKQYADITLMEEGGEISTTATRRGLLLAKASMRLEKRVTEPTPWPYEAFFNLKVIPSGRKGAPPDVLKLMSVPLDMHSTEMHVGPATVEFANPFEGLGQIPVLGEATARFDVYDGTLDWGEELVDYLGVF